MQDVAVELGAGLVAQRRLTETLGQQVPVHNRGGAGGNIGIEVAAKAPPDGYTLLLGHTGMLATHRGARLKRFAHSGFKQLVEWPLVS